MSDLFHDDNMGTDDALNTKNTPLPDLLRPKTISDIAGQDHLIGKDGVLTRMLSQDTLPSLILWGPPGTGKTTLSRILAGHGSYYFEQISAIFSGVKELRQIFDSAKIRANNGTRTLLFVDEIHRFNKAQQDAFLPVVENGTITLIGATTENPSFELNAALLSRAQVLVLKRLDHKAFDDLITRTENHYQSPLPATPDATEYLKTMADGDGRYFLSLLERIYAEALDTKLDIESISHILQRRAPLYDKGEDAHYNLISALHKSVRGSDADAALYWLARMLAGGEDPHYIARRILRMATEDIGLADPQAIGIALTAWQSFERLGSPEGELAIAQAVLYMATAPKSNAAYVAYKYAMKMAGETGSLMPPKHILNAPTSMMKDMGYGKGYQYDHDQDGAFSGQNYFPDDMPRAEFYTPPERGFEREINKRLEYWKKRRNT